MRVELTQEEYKQKKEALRIHNERMLEGYKKGIAYMKKVLKRAREDGAPGLIPDIFDEMIWTWESRLEVYKTILFYPPFDIIPPMPWETEEDIERAAEERRQRNRARHE